MPEITSFALSDKKLNPLGKNQNPTIWNLISEFEETVWVCATLNARKLASAKLRLYAMEERTDLKTKSLCPMDSRLIIQKMRLNASEQLKEVMRHQVLTLLNNPNDDMDWCDLIEQTELFLETVGLCYWYIPKNILGVPQNIVILLPQSHKPLYDKNTGRFVGLTTIDGDDRVKYPANEVIRFKMPGLRGQDAVSPLKSVWETVNIDSKINARMADMLDNNARPDFIVAPKGEDAIWTEDTKARYKTEYLQAFGGSGSGKVWFADGDMTATPLNFSPTDTSIFTQKQISKTDICNAHGVPVALLEGNQFNRATLEAAKELHAETVEYLAKKIAGRLNKYLLPMFDQTEGLFFAFDDISPENRQEKVSELNTLRSAQIITGNEARFELGLPPRPDAETLHPIVPGLNETTSSEDTAEPETVDVPEPVEEKPQDQAMNGAQISSMVDIIANVREGIIPVDSAAAILQAAYPALTEQQINAIIDPLKTLPQIEQEQPQPPAPVVEEQPQEEPEQEEQKSKLILPDHVRQEMVTKAKDIKPNPVPDGEELRDVVIDFYKRKRLEVIGDLQKGMTKALPTKFVPLEEWTDELSDEVRPVIEFYFDNEGKSLLERIGASTDVFSVTNPETAKAIDKIVFAFCQSTVESTTKQLNDALSQLRSDLASGLEDGDSIQLMTRAVNDIFEGLTRQHAELIARTEASRAHHMGLIEAAKASGVAKGMKWVSSPDDPDGRCSPLNGKIVGFDEPFATGQSNKPEYATTLTPPLHPNCLCSLTVVIDDE